MKKLTTEQDIDLDEIAKEVGEKYTPDDVAQFAMAALDQDEQARAIVWGLLCDEFGSKRR